MRNLFSSICEDSVERIGQKESKAPGKRADLLDSYPIAPATNRLREKKKSSRTGSADLRKLRGTDRPRADGRHESEENSRWLRLTFFFSELTTTHCFSLAVTFEK